MKKTPAVIVFDCGATNVRAVAIDCYGRIIASKAFANQTYPDPLLPGGLIWDTGTIWQQLSDAARNVMSGMQKYEIAGVCTTTFCVDGAPFSSEGNMLYPVISWACKRTESVVDELHDIVPLERLYELTGLASFPFNTIYKLFWLKKHKQDLWEQTRQWLFMPTIINKHLCDALYTDVSMAGTSMLCEQDGRIYSEEILTKMGLPPDIFPPLKEAGEIIGRITQEASHITGIPAGTPVFAAGHDTQFAIFGSGAGFNEPVLSSGTWEILMVRTGKPGHDEQAFRSGITTELDAMPGTYNPGIQWLGSDILEWIRKNLFSDITYLPEVYDIMEAEARKAGPADIDIGLDFISGQGKLGKLDLHTSRGQIYYSVLGSLAIKTRDSLRQLEKSCNFKAASLLVAGGGSKNKLWNELRNSVLGLPVKPIRQAETTVLGAAMFAFAGAGVYKNPEEARKAMLNI